MSRTERSYAALLQRRATARRLFDEGWDPADIATHLNVNWSTVNSYLTHDVEPPRDAPESMILRPLDLDLEWQDEGLCREVDNDIFFPDKGGSTADAKAICRGCPVTNECLAYALRHDERFGVWGGKSERERRRLRTSA